MDENYIEDHIDDVEDFLWSIIVKYNLDPYPSIDQEDLFQESWLALKNSEDSYDPDLAEFDTYAYNVIENKIKNILDKNARFSNRENNYNNADHKPLVENLPDDRTLSVEKQARLEITLDKLQPIERRILELHSEGYTQEEIAQNPDINYSRPHVSKVLSGVKNKVRRLF